VIGGVGLDQPFALQRSPPPCRQPIPDPHSRKTQLQ
jgi:hypothetical protein